MTTKRRIFTTGLLSWLAMLGFDFFLHGGVLAWIYVRPEPFLLPPEDAFRLIPVGYLGLALTVILLIWLLARLEISGWRQGLVFGLKFGALSGGAMLLGMLSITNAKWDLLLSWAVGQAVGLGVGGMVAGSGLAGKSLRPPLWVRVVIFIVIMFVVTIAMQSFGLAPVTRI